MEAEIKRKKDADYERALDEAQAKDRSLISRLLRRDTPRTKARRRAKAIAQKKQISLEKRIARNTHQWVNVVLKNYPCITASSKKLERLCFAGIPPKCRSKAWVALVGNTMKVTPQLFASFKSKLSIYTNVFSQRLRRKKLLRQKECGS